MSQALGLSKRSWLTHAKEMLVVVVAVKVWSPYLMGRKFFIQTYQRNLKYFLDQRIITPEQKEWVAKLFGYDYQIIHKSDKENTAADELSRQVSRPSLDAIFVSQSQIWYDIKEEAANHPYMQKVAKLANEKPNSPCTWRNELFFYKNCVMIPPRSNIIQQLLQAFHDSQVGRHSGVL